MNNIIIGILALVGSATAVYTDTPGKLMKLYDESILAARQIATAGDMHSITVMLDAHYIMNRELPVSETFTSWLRDTFKRNNVKDLEIDQWGNFYVYRLLKSEREYMLRCVGPDGVAETDDDMVVYGP